MIKINLKEKALVDSETGNIERPECFDTLIAYHSYLIGRKRVAAAENLLEDVFKGTKVISKMIENAQKRQLIQ